MATSPEMLQGFELSPQQKQIWRLQQQDGDRAYRCRCVFSVTGELEPVILAMVLRNVVERYEVLRTRFELLPGMAQPLQVISKEADFVYICEDASDLPMTEQSAKCDVFLESISATDEESKGKTVLSVRHLILSRERHLLGLEVSTLNADAISLHLLGREIGRAYESFLQEQPVAEPEVQYIDVSETMNECLEKDEFDIGRQYWREQIAGLDQSHGRQESVPSGFQPRVFRTQGADRLWEIAEEFCVRSGVSGESLLLAAWGLVLSRMEGAGEALISVCCDGRTEDILLAVIGLLSRPVPFLFRPKAAGSFREVVLDVHNLLAEISDEQLYYDPVMLNQAAGGDRAYKTCFEYVRMPTHDEGALLAFSLESLLTVTDRYAMKLTAVEVAGQLRYHLEYDETTISESEVQRAWDSFRTLVESGLNHPDRRVELLDLLSEKARAELMACARGEAVDWEIESVHGMFEVQAKARPDGVAVVYEGEHLSYGELNRRGNQLGNYLKQQGVGVEERVGLYLERSVEMMIGVLGVLKCGAAYVPLDASYPKERLLYMVEEAGADVVLTAERLVAGLPLNNAKEICLDKEWGRIGEQRDCKVEVDVNGQNLAYVIYTSGSSGRPKGVMIPHRSVCNHMRWMQSIYPLRPQDRMLQKTAIGFDAAGTEIWLPLLAGGTVVVAREGGQRDVEYLGRMIWQEGVTILQVVPTLLREMLGNENGLPGGGPLRLVYSGGELLTTELAEKFMRTTRAELCNLYGPTEATIDASGWKVRRTERVERVPIGRPILNSQGCVLDREMQLVPIGVTGEIYLGGTAVGRGYLNRADMTAEKYLPNVLGDEGERLYRTGDYGRVNERGELEYLGRIDEQVKVRGYRIELGEIEAVMAGHEGVRQCAVVERENVGGEKQLVGYVVPTSLGSVSIAEIRRYLGEQLPDYMVPSAIVQIEAMPLTSNGKLNRKALPGLEFSVQKESFVAPRGAIEEILCNIWAEVLRVDSVSARGDFFELGGHSLLAMQVVSRIRRLLGVEVSLRSLFSNPTPAAIAVEVEQQQKPGEKAAAPPFVRVERPQNLPLSFAQRRLQFIDQLLPGNAAYNMPSAVRLRGKLDVNVLHKCFNEIVSRHESLRTSFPSDDGVPRQKISDVAELRLEFLDVINTGDSEQLQLVRRAVKKEVEREFDLSSGPLVRAKLIRLAEYDHVLVVTLHHIIGDGWSMGVIIRELSQLYEAFSQGQSSPLPELEIQYADYAIWQRAWLEGGVLDAQLQYWKEKLDGVVVLELPMDRARPAAASYRGATERIQMSEELTGKLSQLNRREGVTMFMSLLAGFQTLLARYSGQEDIAVGTPVAGRNREETEGLIGLFLNTLVARVNVGGNPTVSELLGRVRDTALGAFAHQDLPFEKLVEEFQPERTLSRPPLFQVWFVMQNIPGEKAVVADLTLEMFPIEDSFTKFDLALTMSEGASGLSASLQYSTDLFERTSIERLLTHLRRVLEGMAEDEKARVMELPLMSEEERREVIYGWNETGAENPGERCVHELFEEQAELRRDGVAVVYEGEQLSYGELNRRANQVAHHLRGMGVGAEVKVGLCVERSLEMIVGLLGVMKAGGAYLPLEAGYPRERLAYMIEDGECVVTITVKAVEEKLGGVESLLVNLERDWERIGGESEENPGPAVTGDNLAYVIYTSGSTGRPKGVGVGHGQIVNYTRALAEKLRGAAGERYALISTIGADLGNTMVFPSLLGGGCLHIIGQERATDAEGLGEYFVREEIDYLKIVPSHLKALHMSGSGKEVMPNRVLVIGGEAAGAEWLRELGREKPRCGIMNHYGPTEATVGAVTQRVGEGERWETRSGTVVLGRPISNVQVYILDERQEPVPVGVGGELYIGGEGVARGYQKRGGETGEKFMANPFGEAGSRMYRTGDRARYEEDGKIEFLGRVDDQVKLRGYRIELGEIEAALNKHGSVEQVVVLAREDEPGERRLVAYVVMNEEEGSAELRAYLSERLPEYMVPSKFVKVEEMPLTANGKIDRRSLPRPELNEPGGGYVAAGTAVEEILCDIWSEVLGVERVGVEDNFFELGGDSILSIQVIAKARQAGVWLTPRQLFERQTIGELAEIAGFSSLVEGEQGELRGEVPLTPIQRAFFERGLAKPEHFNQSVMFEIKGDTDSQMLERSVQELVKQHDGLRLRYEQKGGKWVQEYGEVRTDEIYRRVEITAKDEVERVRGMEEDAARQQGSLSLSAGRMMRAVEYDLGGMGKRLLLIVHHLAMDGVSWRILLEDVQRGYEQLKGGEEIGLGRKTTSYRKWGEELEEYSRSEELRAEVEYWERQQGRGGEIEEKKEEEGENSYSTARGESRWLSEERTRELLQEVPGVYHTQINDVLLAVLWEANRRWKGERRLVVELEGHGREEIFGEVDVSRTVGWFTTMYPVKLEAESEELGGALKEIKEVVRAVPRKGIGYGVLRYLSRDEEVAGRLRGGARAEVRFNYLGQFDQVFKEEGLFKPAGERSGPSQAAENRMMRALGVSGMVVGGRLKMEWVYSEKEHSREGMAELANHYMEALEEMIEHCGSEGAGGYTPSDFPLTKMDQGTLERVIGARQRVQEIYRLSPMQQGLLFHTLYEGGTGTYYEQMSCRIEGELKVEEFKRAWQVVVDRHAILRSSFVWEGVKEPVQMVEEGLKIEFREEDWRGDTGAEQRRKLEELLREEREQGFELTKAPLMKMGLARVAEDAYYFIWGNHHILFDGWCRQLIIGEVFKFYEGYSRGLEVELERVRPYRDYIAWLGEQSLKEAEEFWREELRGIEGPTELGIARSGRSEEGENEQKNVRMSEETSRKLEEVAKKWQVTLNTVVEGAWAVVMSRYSGQREVVFGATVSGRDGGLKGIERMVGLFINTLPVRAEVRGEERVKDLMRRLQEKQSKVREYEYSPLMDVQGWSEVPRGVPLFETSYAFQNYPLDGGIRERAGSSLGISEIKRVSRNNYELVIRATPGKELLLNAIYDNGRYEASGIERLLKHLQQVLEGMAEHEQDRVRELSLMSPQEQQQVIVALNEAAADFPVDCCMHELFEQQVELTSDAVAVVYEGEQLTYDELNRRANQLAHHLRGMGVGAEAKVGLCAERSLEMIIGLLGIMKAGGAYLPIDPGYPKERIGYMLSDSGAKIALVQSRFKERVGEICPIVELEQSAEKGNEANAGNLAVEVSGENLAYLIYTSGSTGQPKGCEVNHRNVARLFKATESLFKFNEEDVWTLFHSYTFDFSVWEIWGALAYGGRLIVVPQAVTRSLEKFHELLCQHEVTVLNQTPLAFRHLLQVDKKSDHASALRWVIFGGDALDFTSLQPWFERYGEKRPKLVNMYGITETTVHVTRYVIHRQDAEAPTSRIGRGLPDLRLCILDPNLDPTPIGIAGELFVGGAGVARGYLNRGDLTGDRFIPDRFSPRPGARLYRTGDLARYLGDGETEYLGRLDQQVKIRGYRIELGEIEAAINEHPSVEQVTVLAREDEPGEKRLVGYYVANQSVKTPELREYLLARLPDYMVPGAFVQLEEMPLTPNGKLDRRALPRPEMSKESGQYVAARTAVEAILCGIWSQVLKTGRVSVLDNFFDLGGDSLRVMEAISLARDAGLQLTARHFFESQTVIDLARQCQSSGEEAYESTEALLVPARVNGSKSPLFLVHAAGGGVDFLWPIAHHLEPDQPFYGFRFKGLSLTEIYKPELEDVAAEYLDLMKAVQPRGPYMIGGLSLGVYIAFEMARQLQNRGEAVSLLALIDSGPSGFEGLRYSASWFAMDLAKRFGVDVSREEIGEINPDARLDYVLKRIESVTSNHDYSQIVRVAPAWYGHMCAAEQYLAKALADPQSYIYTGKISLFRTPGNENTSLGWSLMSSQDVDISMLSGTHDDLLNEPYVGSLARMLTRAISKYSQTTLKTFSA